LAQLLGMVIVSGYVRMSRLRMCWWLVGLVAAASMALSATAWGAVAPVRLWRNAGEIDASPVTGLSCPSSSLCVAVDSTGHVATSASPAGGAGTWTSSDVDGSNDIVALSCPSVSLCVAVDAAGDVLASTDPTGGASAWTVSHVDSSTAAPGSYISQVFESISCASVSLCVAVDSAGDVATSTNPAAGGGTWDLSHIDDEVYYECYHYGSEPCQSPLIDISCPSLALCVAADGDGYIFTSTDPAAVPPPSWQGSGVTPYSEFDGISCPTDSLCVGICPVGAEMGNCPGTQYGAGDLVTWNPAGGNFEFAKISADQLSGIWCPFGTLCFAADPNRGLLVTEDPGGGSKAWTVADKISNIAGVACPTDSLCVAVSRAGTLLLGSPPPTAAQIQALLRGHLAPTGKSARISTLLDHGRYTMSFEAPIAGRLAISWYLTNHVLIASGTIEYAKSGTREITIKLTLRGTRLLRQRGRATITARGDFTPSDTASVVASRTFELVR
jgi:hypothetical protein